MKIFFKSADLAADLQKNLTLLKNTVPFFNSVNTGLVNRARLNTRNKGGRNFWEKIGKSVASEQGENLLRVKSEMPEAIHAEYGGVIRARFRSRLTIPVNGEAKGKEADFFRMKYGENFFILRSKKQAVLAVKTGRSKKNGVKVLFVLKKETRPQKPRPWWPTDGEINAVLEENLNFWLNNNDVKGE